MPESRIVRISTPYAASRQGHRDLPSRFGGNWSQPTATVLAYLSRFRGGPICDRLPPVATALLHKRSIPLRGLRVGSVQINSLRRVRARERSHSRAVTSRTRSSQ